MGVDPARYAIPYRDLKVIVPRRGLPARMMPYAEATMTVLLETSPEKISAKVLKVEAAKK